MAADDMRDYITFYGIETNDWVFTFGTFSDHHKLLKREYISDACDCQATSVASDTNEFVYQHHLKKTYFIEGVISGHVTFAASGATSHITEYRVTVGKVNQDGTKEELFTTGWVSVDDNLSWNATYSIGEERVYPFEIDAWEKEKLEENDRIFVRIESDSDGHCVLWHDNNQTFEDFKIEIPFLF